MGIFGLPKDAARIRVSGHFDGCANWGEYHESDDFFYDNPEIADKYVVIR